jgi:hypothetical protein
MDVDKPVGKHSNVDSLVAAWEEVNMQRTAASLLADVYCFHAVAA